MAGPYNTPLYNQQIGKATNLYFNPSAADQQLSAMVFRQEYTVVGTEVATELINLGFPKIPNMKLMPRLSSVTCPSGAGAAMVMTLQKVDPAGTATPLTAAATQVAASEVAFAKPATVPTVPVVDVEDYLQVLLGTVTTKTAGTIILFELVFVSADTP